MSTVFHPGAEKGGKSRKSGAATKAPQKYHKSTTKNGITSFTLADLDTIAGCLGCRLSVQFVDTDTGAVLVDRIPY